MTEIELTPTRLIVHVRGLERVLTFKSQLEIPLTHVITAEIAPISGEEWASWSVLRAAGTALPGIIRAGSFLQRGEWVFWDVRSPEKAVTIQLADEHYVKLVVEVADPVATATAITEAIRRQAGA
jgi:hypothetical protein